MADLLVDTDILIDMTRGMPEAIAFIQRHEQQTVIGVSTVTYLELLVGCRNKGEQRQIEQFMQRFEVVKLNEMIADRAIDLIRQYRLSHGLLVADALIAATVIWLGRPFASRNQRDYRFITGLTLQPYP